MSKKKKSILKKRYVSYQEMIKDVYDKMKDPDPQVAAEAKRIYNALWKKFAEKSGFDARKIKLPAMKRPAPTKAKKIPEKEITRDVWVCDCGWLNVEEYGGDMLKHKCGHCGKMRV